MELYQRIEQLIGKQLPLYRTDESAVMVLQERVAEAQAAAPELPKVSWSKSPSKSKATETEGISAGAHS